MRVANLDRSSFAEWLRRRPFAAALPIQPMLIVPLEPPLSGIELTFRRKPSSEKGSTDGGLRFMLVEPDEHEEEQEPLGSLMVARISEGQYTTKMFSEQKLLRRLVADLESLPADCGSVASVVDLTSPSSPGRGDPDP